MSHRVTATISDDQFERLKYWAKKRGLSINEYLNESLDHMIRYENRDYDLPELEVQRLNQLIDSQAVLSSNVKSLEEVVIHGFDSLLNLTRGDNYLI